MMTSLKWIVFLAVAGLGIASAASAGLALRDGGAGRATSQSVERTEGGCPASTFDVYFPALESEVSAEAKAVMMGLALAYRGCRLQRIEIASLAVDSASPDSTPEIAAERGENLAGLMRLIFFGRTHVVVRVERAEDGFGPEARRAKVHLVT